MDQLHLSKEMRDALIKNAVPGKNKIHVGGYEIPVHESPLFPFEMHYDACDVKTRQLIKVGSGELIHGVIIPQVGFEEDHPPFYLLLDDYKNNFRGFSERNWAMEIFKF